MYVSSSKKRLAVLVLCLALLAACPGCAKTQAASGGRLRVVTTTFPVYALTAAVSAGVDGVELSRLNTGQVSCLHDYTLTAADARRLEQADLLLLNGAGLEGFLHSALESLPVPAADCSAGVMLLEADGEEHHHHDEDSGEHDHDPHFWMDPRCAAVMAGNIADALCAADPVNGERYRDNAAQVSARLLEEYSRWKGELAGLSCPYLITFHDGFRYFAHAFGLELLFAMEEEDGATASAKDIRTASGLVKEYRLPCIFMEHSGSGSAARAVAGETGAAVRALSMLMDGPAAPPAGTAEEALAALYLAPMEENIKTLREVLS